jgi:hypothetical protein
MKRLVFVFLVIIAVYSIADAKYSGGSGNPNDPYQIANVSDLLNLAADTNDYNKCFIMTADIDLDPNLPGNQVFTTAVIAPDTDPLPSSFDGTPFTGSFNGNGHKIMNLKIDTSDANTCFLGLFGVISGSAAHVKNLTIDNAVITGGSASYMLGCLCGSNSGTISNCFFTGQVTGKSWLGGLCGGNGGTIRYCYANCQVIGVNGSQDIGGLCGTNNGNISNCYATGQVTSGNGSKYVGGLCGENYLSTISNSYATGQVTSGIGSTNVGGLCGYNHFATISNCYSTGHITVYYSSAGGFCGLNYSGSCTACFWDINTSGQTTSAGGTGKTTAQMQTQSTFTDAGWDFVWETVNGPNDIWTICEGVSYPKLAWQFVVADFDNDRDVNFTDFALMGNKWHQADSTFLYCGGKDLTGDEWVDLEDLDTFVENWLQGL